MIESKTMFMRRSDVMRFLGVTKYQLECLLTSKALKQVSLQGMKQKYFLTKDVQKLKENYERSEHN